MIHMPFSPLDALHGAMLDYHSAVKRKDNMRERMDKFTDAFRPVVERIQAEAKASVNGQSESSNEF